MTDRKYLLSIKELKTELEKDGLNSSLAMQALEKLDTHRKEKMLRITHPGKCAESVGAGLLLQLGLQECDACKQDVNSVANEKNLQESTSDAREEVCKVQELTISEILSRLSVPVEVTYCYGEKGKPYFADIPLYFSISHCEDYVLCVFSDQEIGADIQYEKSVQEERIVQRYFAPEEKVVWEKCTDPEARRKLFYRLWTGKEAYAKLLGKGIADEIGMDMDSLDVCFEEYVLENDYRIAICKQNPGSGIENATETGMKLR